MSELIEEFEEKTIPCSSCKREVTLKSFIIKDAKPYRFISYADCTNCGFKDTFEEDYQVLDHGVKITCNFSSTDSNHDLRRMAYVHKGAKIAFFDGTQELFSFSSDRSHVDCIEGIWLRGKEILEADQASSDRNHKELINSVEQLLKGGKFNLIISDDSGYSKVCPYGMEYTQIENCSFEELNKKDTAIAYERYERNNLAREN